MAFKENGLIEPIEYEIEIDWDGLIVVKRRDKIYELSDLILHELRP